jgi:Zn-dependent peptidase ImmA (M78 family)
MTRQEIIQLAEEKAKKYNPDGLSPFPFEKIQQDNKDLQIIYSNNLPDNNISGIITFITEENKFIIFVNTNKAPVRQHFSIAHEIGHYFLHKEIIKKEELIVDQENSFENKILFRLDGAEYDQIETEANIFAAVLIMPENLVRKAWDEFKNVEECANIFSVSTSAMSIRLERLGLIT